MHVVNPIIRDAVPANAAQGVRYESIDWDSINRTHAEEPRSAREWFEMVMGFYSFAAEGGNVEEFFRAPLDPQWKVRWSEREREWLIFQLDCLFVAICDDAHQWQSGIGQLPSEIPRLMRVEGEWYWHKSIKEPGGYQVARTVDPYGPSAEQWVTVREATSPQQAIRAVYIAGRA